MDHALTNALKRKTEIERELAEIEQFIALHRRFSGTVEEHMDMGATQILSATERGVPLSEDAAKDFARPRGRPAELANAMAAILRDVRKPLVRGEFVRELENRGVEIPSEDKARYLGTILWRRSDMFESVGDGYWLKGIPRPQVEDDLIDCNNTLVRMSST